MMTMPNSVNSASALAPHPLSKQFHDEQQARRAALPSSRSASPAMRAADSPVTSHNPGLGLLDIPADVWAKKIAPRLELKDLLALQQTSKKGRLLMSESGSLGAKLLHHLQTTLLEGFDTDRLMPVFWEESNGAEVMRELLMMGVRMKKYDNNLTNRDVQRNPFLLPRYLTLKRKIKDFSDKSLPKTISASNLKYNIERALSCCNPKMVAPLQGFVSFYKNRGGYFGSGVRNDDINQEPHPLRYECIRTSALYSSLFADSFKARVHTATTVVKIDLFRFEACALGENNSAHALNAPSGMLDRLPGLEALHLASENGSFALHHFSRQYELHSVGGSSIEPSKWRQPAYLLNRNLNLKKLTLHTALNEALPCFLENAEASAANARASPGVMGVRELRLDAQIIWDISNQRSRTIYKDHNREWAVHTPSEKAQICETFFRGLKQANAIHIEGGEMRSIWTGVNDRRGIYFRGDYADHRLTRTQLVRLIGLAPKVKEITFPDASMHKVLPVEENLQYKTPEELPLILARYTAVDLKFHPTLVSFKMGDIHFKRATPADEFERA
jgi:hypothetical protein